MSEQKSPSWLSRLGGLRRRRRRRGPLARAPRLGRTVAEEPREEEAAHGSALGFPVRARPGKIEFIEEYHYKIKVERNALHDPLPSKTLGEIQIMLPCDKMGREALADAMRHTARHAGDLPVRYGWLALAHIGKSNLAERLPQVRPWDKPPYQAFPLLFPLIGESTERLEDQIESGALGWEQLYYRPDPPLPFPVEFHLFMARDSAVPGEPLPPGAPEGYRLPAPNAASGLEWALHVSFSVNLRRPKGVTEENCKISVGRLHINWPVPVVAEQLEWQGPPEARFYVDERYKQVVVEGVPLRMTSQGKGPLRGEIAFRIGVRQPATLLRGDRFFKGRFRLDASNITLSSVRALYFDAAGYLQALNCDDKPLLSYRTEVHGEFEYVLDDTPPEGVPLLWERRYSWLPMEPVPKPFAEVEQALRERGFEFNQARGWLAERVGQRWWATREIAGYPLILDVTIEQREPPMFPLAPLTKQADRVMMASQPIPKVYEISLRGYYRGAWEEAMEQVRWLEERLHHRLNLRHEEH